VNPQVLHLEHYLQKKCLPAYWTGIFEADVMNMTPNAQQVAIYCRDDDRIEFWDIMKTQLVMRLGGGFFSQEDWVTILSHLRDPVKAASGKTTGSHTFPGTPYFPTLHSELYIDTHAGSHLCANGFDLKDSAAAGRVNLFCMV
jgi:hypothetical protein